MEVLVCVLPMIAGGVVMVGAVIAYSIKSAQRANEGWQQAGRQLGFHFQPGGLARSRKLTGTIRGCRLQVDTCTVSTGSDSSTTYTRFRLTFSDRLPLDLQLAQEGFLAGVTKFFGAQDIEVGDAGFDDSFLIKGSDPEQIREFLTPARRIRIDRYFRGHPNAKIDSGGIAWQMTGVIKDAARLVGHARAMVELAHSLTGDRDEDRRVAQVIEFQDRGEPGAALEILAAGPAVMSIVEFVDDDQPPVEPVLEQVLLGELQYLAGQQDEAHQTFQQALDQAPGDPEIAEWVQRTSTETTSEETPAADTTADLQPTDPGPPEPSEPVLDVAAVCGELFESGGGSYAANRAFEEKYQDKSVRWTGTLKRAEPFEFDLVFGTTAATKAVIAVYEADSVTYGDRTISAVARFSREDHERLEAAVGREVTFEGRLQKVDGFMRNIYVADAQLV